MQNLKELGVLEKSKIAFYFSSSVADCYILKTLLKETKHDISVYYYDKISLLNQKIDYTKEQQSTLSTLEYYKKTYRDFSFQKVNFINSEYNNPKFDIEDPQFHIDNLGYLYNALDKFDYFILTQNLHFFTKPFCVAELYNKLKSQNLNIKIITPFSGVLHNQISKEALADCLSYQDINFDKIHNDNKEIIDLIKQLFGDSKKKVEIDNLITNQTNFDEIYRYLLSQSSINICVSFLEHYGQNVCKALHISCLKNIILFTPSREQIITYSVVKGGLTDNDLNKILLDFVKSWVYSATFTTQEKIDRFDYFMRLYEHKITEETKDQLMHLSVLYTDFINKPFLAKMVDFGGDVGELMIRWIDGWDKKPAEFRVHYLLDQHLNKIHPLQLNEALLKAFQKGNYELSNKLIQAGADRRLIQFHSVSYGWNQFTKEAEKHDESFFRDGSFWRTKDRVIIKEILKQLGNPEGKVPPVFHVTGSNGKGSACAFLRSILENNGYKAHVFTSPSIIRDNENCILAGNEITDEQYYQYLTRAKEAYDKIKDLDPFKEKLSEANKKDNLSEEDIKKDGILSWAIIIPAIILAFSEIAADATIIEVITGGEFDLTNVFDEKTTVATIINTIIYGDSHANLRGFESIEAVANTKSRLAKKGVPIICAAQEDAVLKVTTKNAAEIGCHLMVFEKDFFVTDHIKNTTKKDDLENYFTYQGFGKKWKLLKPKLVGGFQINNAALAITALIQNQDKFLLKEKMVSDGVCKAYHIARFCEISNDKLLQYDKVYFGSSKSKFGTNLVYKNNLSDTDMLLTITGDSDEFLGGRAIEDFDKCNQVISIATKQNVVLIDKLSKVKNLTKKQYLSSSISKISDIKGHAKNLSILTIGIRSFPKNYLAILFLLNQPNFKQNFAFAKKYKLLTLEQITLISGKDL